MGKITSDGRMMMIASVLAVFAIAAGAWAYLTRPSPYFIGPPPISKVAPAPVIEQSHFTPIGIAFYWPDAASRENPTPANWLSLTNFEPLEKRLIDKGTSIDGFTHFVPHYGLTTPKLKVFGHANQPIDLRVAFTNSHGFGSSQTVEGYFVVTLNHGWWHHIPAKTSFTYIHQTKSTDRDSTTFFPKTHLTVHQEIKIGNIPNAPNQTDLANLFDTKIPYIEIYDEEALVNFIVKTTDMNWDLLFRPSAAYPNPLVYEDTTISDILHGRASDFDPFEINQKFRSIQPRESWIDHWNNWLQTW